MTFIGIVDVGLGNVGSVANMLRKIGVACERVTDPSRLRAADKVVLPGVGAFDVAMERLESGGWIEPILEVVASGRPLLGICLGMQLLAEGSEEGDRSGLGVIPGFVRRLRVTDGAARIPIPHMGWNTIRVTRDHGLFVNRDNDARYYFVHSFAYVPDHQDDVLAETEYGNTFVSAVGRDGVSGVQFHPEKSHRHGMALLRGFAGS